MATPNGVAAELSRSGDNYCVQVGNIRLALYGTYPRVDYMVPEDLLYDAEIFYPRNPNKKVAVPARAGSLRPRIARLEFGEFLVSRIAQAANSGEDVFVQ